MKKQRNRSLYIFLIIAVLTIAAGISLGAYTSSQSEKRVVTVKGTEQCFSSNILFQYDDVGKLQTKAMAFGDGDKAFTVTVSNYVQGYKSRYDKKNINYNLSVVIIDDNGNPVTDSSLYNSLYINDKQVVPDTSTVPGKTIMGNLTGGVASDNNYNIKVTGDDITKYRIKITAVPTDRPEFKSIGRIVSFASLTVETHWSGEFLKPETSAANNNEKLGIINYKISGHIEENYLLKWDSSKVNIDKWFLEQNNVTATDGEDPWKEVQLHLGAADTPKQYIITFYRTYSPNDMSENGESIEKYIRFEKSGS